MTQISDLRTAARPAGAGASAGSESTGAVQRPLAVGAALAGAAAAGTVLVACMAVGLAGWFASDGGSHGDTRDALRVGADAWLLAHGSWLDLGTASITAVPLGLTALCAYVAFRLGRWAGATSAVDDVRTAAFGALALAGSYAGVATLTAVLASHEVASPHPGLAFLGGLSVGGCAGGAGIVLGSGLWPVWRVRVPEFLRSVVVGGASVVLLMLVAGSVLASVMLLLDYGDAATVLSRLRVDLTGGLLFSLLVAAVSPNAALLAGAYLVGPGFTVGTGTLVSPAAVGLGPVPAFPLLAALPDEGVTPAWTVGLATVPVVLAALGAALMLRRHPVPSLEVGALRGLTAGVVGGVMFTAAAFLAGGSVGPGRMSEVGVLLTQTLVASVSAMGVGGLLGGLAMTWWVRRRILAR